MQNKLEKNEDGIFLLNFSVSVDLEKNKLSCDYTYNESAFENDKIVDDLSIKFMNLVANVVFEEVE